jgi:hypothetical protein
MIKRREKEFFKILIKLQIVKLKILKIQTTVPKIPHQNPPMKKFKKR